MTLHNCRRICKSLKLTVNKSKTEKENELSDSLIREEGSIEFVTKLKILPRDMEFGIEKVFRIVWIQVFIIIPI